MFQIRLKEARFIGLFVLMRALNNALLFISPIFSLMIIITVGFTIFPCILIYFSKSPSAQFPASRLEIDNLPGAMKQVNQTVFDLFQICDDWRISVITMIIRTLWFSSGLILSPRVLSYLLGSYLISSCLILTLQVKRNMGEPITTSQILFVLSLLTTVRVYINIFLGHSFTFVPQVIHSLRRIQVILLIMIVCVLVLIDTIYKSGNFVKRKKSRLPVPSIIWVVRRIKS